MDWGAVSSWVAAVVSATSAGVALWSRWHDRPEADWAPSRDGLSLSGRQAIDFTKALHLDGPPNFVVRLTNVGDGPAYDIQVVPVGCSAAMFEISADDTRGFSGLEHVGVIRPGEFVLVAAHVPTTVDGEAGLRVEWTQPPTRFRRRLAQAVVLVGKQPGPRRQALPPARWAGLAPAACRSPRWWWSGAR